MGTAVTSGRTRTKAERRAAGWTRLEMLLSPETEQRLFELCADAGTSRADTVRALIDREWAEMQELRA